MEHSGGQGTCRGADPSGVALLEAHNTSCCHQILTWLCHTQLNWTFDSFSQIVFHHAPTLTSQLHNQHAIAEHVELVSTLLSNLIIAAHNKILAREGGRKHNVARPRPVQVGQ